MTESSETNTGRTNRAAMNSAIKSAAERRASTTPAGATAFAHMLLKVADIERSRRFYVDLLGFTVRPAKPLADGRPFVPFHQGLAITSGGTGAGIARQIDHIAFKANDVRAIAERLKAADVTFIRDLHDGIYGLTIYVADPDGTMIELYEEGERMG